MEKRFLFQQDTGFLVRKGLCHPHLYTHGYQQALSSLKALVSLSEKGYLPFLKAPFEHEERLSWLKARMQKKFSHLKLLFILADFQTTLVLRAMAGLMQSWVWVPGSWPRICFLDQADPKMFWELMSIANPETTGLIIISPSGEDKDVILQGMRCLEYWSDVKIEGKDCPEEADPSLPSFIQEGQSFSRQVLIMTGVMHSELGALGAGMNIEIWPYPMDLHHSPLLGCFYPQIWAFLMLRGFSGEKFLQGAMQVCTQFFQGTLKVPLEYWALWRSLSQGTSVDGVKPYYMASSQAFSDTLRWMAALQNIFFESFPDGFEIFSAEGEGTSLFPGTYRERKCGWISFFCEQKLSQEPVALDFWDHVPQLKALAPLSLAQHQKQRWQQKAQYLADQGHGVRLVKVAHLNEEVLGGLMMNHMVEMLISRHSYDLPLTPASRS